MDDRTAGVAVAPDHDRYEASESQRHRARQTGLVPFGAISFLSFCLSLCVSEACPFLRLVRQNA